MRFLTRWPLMVKKVTILLFLAFLTTLQADFEFEKLFFGMSASSSPNWRSISMFRWILRKSKTLTQFYPRFRTQESEIFQKTLFWPETSYVGWTWCAYSEKRLFKFKIRLSRGQKCQKQQNCHFSWLETDFENFLVTLEQVGAVRNMTLWTQHNQSFLEKIVLVD